MVWPCPFFSLHCLFDVNARSSPFSFWGAQWLTEETRMNASPKQAVADDWISAGSRSACQPDELRWWVLRCLAATGCLLCAFLSLLVLLPWWCHFGYSIWTWMLGSVRVQGRRHPSAVNAHEENSTFPQLSKPSREHSAIQCWTSLISHHICRCPFLLVQQNWSIRHGNGKKGGTSEVNMSVEVMWMRVVHPNKI